MSTKLDAASHTKYYTEHEAKVILAKYGIKTPKGIIVSSVPENLELQFPVALKVSDSAILHKSDVGGVKAGIIGIYDLLDEFDKMGKRFPGSQFLIEEMAPGGVEFIVGIASDPVFGPVIMLGSGGIYTEIYHDVSFRKVPITRKDAVDMIAEIKSGVFCKGFRNIRIDCGDIADLLLKVSKMASDRKLRVESMDLNPVIVSRSGAIVADAKLSVVEWK